MGAKTMLKYAFLCAVAALFWHVGRKGSLIIIPSMELYPSINPLELKRY